MNMYTSVLIGMRKVRGFRVWGVASRFGGLGLGFRVWGIVRSRVEARF